MPDMSRLRKWWPKLLDNLPRVPLDRAAWHDGRARGICHVHLGVTHHGIIVEKPQPWEWPGRSLIGPCPRDRTQGNTHGRLIQAESSAGSYKRADCFRRKRTTTSTRAIS